MLTIITSQIYFNLLKASTLRSMLSPFIQRKNVLINDNYGVNLTIYI